MATTKRVISTLPYASSIYFGCDPELFITKDVGKVRKRVAVVGSERVIPEHGLTHREHHGSIVRDGVQVELHPLQSYCREVLRYRLHGMFQALDTHIKQSQYAGMKINFSQVVKVSRGDLMRLSPDARQLGCQPSLNVYGRTPIQKNGETYQLRSAAGHVHIGCEWVRNGHIKPGRLVHILDVLVGNTCVLLDRDPLAAERRKVYGLAGEYRLPIHGLEYRTLSNFWLRSYPLMSLVMGLTKMAVKVAQANRARSVTDPPSSDGPVAYDAEERLMASVDLEMVEKAINTNNLDLAALTFESAVRPFLMSIRSDEGLDHRSLVNFDHFVKKGLDHWFPGDPLKNWLLEAKQKGWESYLSSVVDTDRQHDKKGRV